MRNFLKNFKSTCELVSDQGQECLNRNESTNVHSQIIANLRVYILNMQISIEMKKQINKSRKYFFHISHKFERLKMADYENGLTFDMD